MPPSVTLNDVKSLRGSSSDPTGEQRVEKEILSAVAVEKVTRVE